MQGIAHRQWLDRVIQRQQRDFQPLYKCLKRCFPGMSDHLLSVMLGVDLTDFYRWKVKTRWPNKAARRLVKFVCLVRIGALHTVYDVIHSGEMDLEKLIEAWEAEEAANQCAKTGQTPSKAKCPAISKRVKRSTAINSDDLTYN